MKKIAVALTIGLLASSPLQAQELDMQSIVDRMERMDRDIKALNIRVYREGASEGAAAAPSAAATSEISGPLGARLSVRITELENQIRGLTGQLEETAFRISQMTTRMDKLVADVDYRLTALEGGNPAARPDTGTLSDLQPGQPAQGGQFAAQSLTPPAGVTQPNLPPASPPGVLGTLTEKDLGEGQPQQAPQALTTTTVVEQPTQVAALNPEDAYQNARKLLVRGDLVGAEAGFKTFLTDNSEHELVGNARYWLGETYYVQSDFPQAAATFLEGYQKSPQGAKAPDSLLKLGMSLSNMDKNTEACSAFSRLRSAFPTMPANISKTLERERTKAECN